MEKAEDSQNVLSQEQILEEFGFGPREAQQVLSFGTHTGTLAEMLSDEGCPVRDLLRDAYRENGSIDAGIEKVQMLGKVWGKEVTIAVSDDTRAYHDGHISRETLLSKSATEKLGFLA